MHYLEIPVTGKSNVMRLKNGKTVVFSAKYTGRKRVDNTDFKQVENR